jgi:ABC-2 type transport system ATP-binding protein
MSADFAVEITGLDRRLGDFHLRDVDLRLPTGYVMGFVGPNGAGKTTTIKAILGMFRPDAGTVKVLGAPVEPGSAGHSRRIGVVLDQTFLVPDWTLPQAASAIAPFYQHWDQPRFLELCERLDVPTTSKIKQLSRGQSIKGMLILALAHNPDLLILDEPTSGLDPMARQDVLDLLREYMTDERHSILFSTHITSDLDRFADYVQVICRGGVVWSGPRDELAEEFAMVRGGSDSLNPAIEEAVWGLRVSPTGFEGLIRTAETALFDADVLIEEPTIDEVVTHLGRGRTANQGSAR